MIRSQASFSLHHLVGIRILLSHWFHYVWIYEVLLYLLHLLLLIASSQLMILLCVSCWQGVAGLDGTPGDLGMNGSLGFLGESVSGSIEQLLYNSYNYAC